MARWTVNVNARGLLNYVQAGRDAVREVKKAVRRVVNIGRTTARQRIASEFGVRTGFLRRQARKMQTGVTVNAAEVKGRVSPIPRLMNIFERGATLAHGRGLLRPRPVVTPASQAMEQQAGKVLGEVLAKVGH